MLHHNKHTKQKTPVVPGPIIAGPIVRHCDAHQLNFWLVTSALFELNFKLYVNNTAKNKRPYKESEYSLLIDALLSDSKAHDMNEQVASTEEKKAGAHHHIEQIQVGKSAFINLITIVAEGVLPENVFPENTLLFYDVITKSTDKAQNVNNSYSITSLTHLLYKNYHLPHIIIKPDIENLLHGSCRKPHYDSDDALKQADHVINQSLNNNTLNPASSKKEDKCLANPQRPSMLIMTGDQVYVDDVAGPMLHAIHQVIAILGLYDEALIDEDKKTHTSNELFQHVNGYYERDKILPQTIKQTLFGQQSRPIFTGVEVGNHLITLAEIMAMYLLTWSPELWELVEIKEPPKHLSTEFKNIYVEELNVIEKFYKNLYGIRRALAHVPVYMIFDDHDITDDWNLTRGWEEAAYSNSLSKQIIGNALIGYWLCQGWGNAPTKFSALIKEHKKYFNEHASSLRMELIQKLYSFHDWNFSLNTSPKIVVLDTRTQRWRSQSNANKPSGLMDWETLCDFQQEIMQEPNVIVVSAAPIYGVKLIETIQRIFTFFGKPIVVDAENWMAHSGTANVILNIFRNPRTPTNFVILSGDVHYSFVYEVTHRFKKNNAQILQVTSSGIKNTFPHLLLSVLEQLNRVLYTVYSPLNWFTKRRRMKIGVRKPDTKSRKHLYNGSSIGLLTFDKKHEKIITQVITAKGKVITFNEYQNYEN